jgi:hypothetical protein
MISLNDTDMIALIKSIKIAVYTNGTMHHTAKNFGLMDNKEDLIIFATICSSFLLQVLNEASDVTLKPAQENDSVTRYLSEKARKDINEMKTVLMRMGAQEHLQMTLLSWCDCGKCSQGSLIIPAAIQFCYNFSEKVETLLEVKMRLFAASFTDFAEKEWIIKCTEVQQQWDKVRLLFIEEMPSSMSPEALGTMDVMLRGLKKQPDKVFGGLSIVFAGDREALQTVQDFY